MTPATFDPTAPPGGGADARGQAASVDRTAPPGGGADARGPAASVDRPAPPGGGADARGQAASVDPPAPHAQTRTARIAIVPAASLEGLVPRGSPARLHILVDGARGVRTVAARVEEVVTVELPMASVRIYAELEALRTHAEYFEPPDADDPELPDPDGVRELELARWTSVQVQVRDEAAAPVPGVRVRVDCDFQDTDTEGRATFASPVGTVAFFVLPPAQRYAVPDERALDVPVGGARVQIQLIPATSAVL